MGTRCAISFHSRRTAPCKRHAHCFRRGEKENRSLRALCLYRSFPAPRACLKPPRRIPGLILRRQEARKRTTHSGENTPSEAASYSRCCILRQPEDRSHWVAGSRRALQSRTCRPCPSVQKLLSRRCFSLAESARGNS